MVSGQLGLTALKFIQSSTNSIVAVLSDTASVEIRNYCAINKIPIFLGNPRKGKAVDFLSKLNCDLLLSINYLYIIEQDLISLPKEYAINFHGSLLPKYRGRTPHVWAIINGETQTGVTAHLIDQNMDSGDIIHQIPIEINPEATGADLLKLFHIVYPELISKVLSNVNKRTLTLRPQDNSKAVYFDRRTPEDGKIDWDWCKKRIRNWIRAQSKPYPGAFTYYDNFKLVVHRSKFSDFGFHYSQSNGTILNVDDKGIVVKTPNGGLELSDFAIESNVKIKKGKNLS